MEYPNLPERKLIDVPANSRASWVPADISQIICPIFSKVMPKFANNFSMTFAKKGTYGVPEFVGMEVNRRSGNLKGLSGYLQAFHKKSTSPVGISTTRWSEHKQPRHDGRGHISSCTYITTSTSTSRERGNTSGREGRLGSEIGVVEVLLMVLQ